MGWSALRVGCKDNHAKSASARVLRGRSARSPRDEARVGRAARNSEAIVTKARSRSRRPGEAELKWSLGQRCGVERAPRWLQRQPRQVRQRARAPWAVRRFCTGRSARGEGGGMGFGSYGHEDSKPQPPTWRGCVEVEPRPTAWDGARSALAVKTTTPSPPARACSVGGRPICTFPYGHMQLLGVKVYCGTHAPVGAEPWSVATVVSKRLRSFIWRHIMRRQKTPWCCALGWHITN